MSWDEIPRDLRSKYLRAAAMTAAQLLRLLGRLQYNPADAVALRVLLQRFHAIAGWGGRCGVPAFTVAGQLGEHDCAALLAACVVPEARHLDQIRSLVLLLLREIRQQQAAPAAGAACEQREQIFAPDRAPRPQYRALCVGIADTEGGQLRRLLARRGICVQFADTSDDAGLLLTAGMPDAVVVGRELVDGSGYVLADYLRCSEGTHRQPIVLIVGGAGEPADLAEQVRCGADGAFAAPFDAAALAASLAELLARRDSEAPRVLCLEPDPAYALALGEVLHDAGYRVRLANDPRRLARQMSAFDPELVVLDIPHPDATTGDLVRRLRAGKRCAVVPILFLTDPGQSLPATPAVLGAEYLARPASPAGLLAAVAGRVDRLRALRQLFADTAPR
jgi:DNA-binding response OmpR family regulator